MTFDYESLSFIVALHTYLLIFIIAFIVYGIWKDKIENDKLKRQK